MLKPVRNLVRLIGLGWTTSRKLSLGSLLVPAAHLIQAIAPLVVAGLVLAAGSAGWLAVVLLSLAGVMCWAGNWVLIVAGMGFQDMLRARLSVRVQVRLTAALAQTPGLEHFWQPQARTVRARLTESGESIADSWAAGVRMVNAVVYPLTMVASAMILSPWAVLLLVGCLPTLLIASFLARWENATTSQAAASGQHCAELLACADDPAASRHAVHLGIVPILRRRLQEAATAWTTVRCHRDCRAAAIVVGLQVVYCLTATLAVGLAVNQGVSAADLSGLLVAVLALYGAVSGLQVSVVEVAAISARIDDLEYLEHYADQGRLPALGAMGTIQLSDVGYTYPDGTIALAGVTATIPAGCRVGLIGDNGSGKSTLLYLLAGLLEPTKGSITRGSVPQPTQPSAVVTGAFQKGLRIRHSLHTEIAAGAAEQMDTVSEEFVCELLSRAGLARLVQPGVPTSDVDLATIQLSEGQWHRMCVTRAQAAAGGWLRLLDEPSSALDALEQARVVDLELGGGSQATKVVVAHSAALGELVDLNMHLDGGRLVGMGSHAQLMETDDVYAELVRQQRAAYGLRPG